MSTFDGIVKEIPFIRVDNFDNNDANTTVFFISHCHSDHMKGINEDFFTMLQEKHLFLYGSPISVRILRNMYPVYQNQLKEVPPDESVLIHTDYKEEIVYLNVTIIPAGHCPGSVMFLFETSNTRVLYTGDFRIDKTQQFFNRYFKEVKKIDNIYLDTTFCKRQYPHFPSRKQSSNGVCEIINNWLSLDEKNIINLYIPAYYGSEYIFMEIFKKTREKICVSQKTYDLHKFIPDLNKFVECHDNQKNIRVHACKLVNVEPHYECNIRITAMIWENYEVGDNVIKCESPNSYKVCASYHPSYNEICEFIEYLKPIKIEPCVVPDDEEEREYMFELLDNLISQYIKKPETQRFKINSISIPKRALCQEEKSLTDGILSSPPRKLFQ